MAARITELVLDCRDPAGLAAWWAEVLGYEVVGSEDGGSVEIGPPGQEPKGVVPTIVFGPVAEPTRASSGCTSTSTPPTATRTRSSSGCSPSAPPGSTSVRDRSPTP
jgi:hypothetical protein